MDTSLGDDEDPDNLLSTKREGTDGDGAGQPSGASILEGCFYKLYQRTREEEAKKEWRRGGG